MPLPPLRIYRVAADDATTCLRQGEILTGLVQVKVDVATLGECDVGVVLVTHPFAITITQDCDLEQDFHCRMAEKASDKLIPSLLAVRWRQRKRCSGG